VRCLELAPYGRLQSMDEVLQHRLFSGSHVQGKVLIVSAPEWGFDPESGAYDCAVMTRLNEPGRCRVRLGWLVELRPANR
jgi:hypothetical protein